MLRLMLRVLVILVGVFAVCIVTIRAGYGVRYPMQAHDIYLHPDCDNPCWMGLEIDHTPSQEVNTLMRSRHDDSVVVPEHLKDTAAAHEKMFVEIRPGSYEGMRSSHGEGVVKTIGFSYRGCPGVVLSQFGMPDEAQIHRETDIKLYYAPGGVVEYNAEHDYFYVEIRLPGIALDNPGYTYIETTSRRDGLARLRARC